MSLQRSISWTAAIRDMRQDRTQVSTDDRRAINAARGYAKIAADRARISARTAPLVVAGRFDRSAIMKAAIVAARARRNATGEAWTVCLSAALTGTWQVAKAARLAVAH